MGELFSITNAVEYVLISVAYAQILGLCSFKLLGALQQTCYKNTTFQKWVFNKKNMMLTRLALLALLTVLSSSIFTICFSSLGRWSAYAGCLPAIIMHVAYIRADKRYALKLPYAATARFRRLYAALLIILTAVIFALCVLLAYLSDLTGLQLIVNMRYIPLCLMPLTLPLLVMLANFFDNLYEKPKNKRYVKTATERLAASKIIKIGLTGSYGKTGVKNILTAMLSLKYKVLSTPSSYNTPLGISKTTSVNLDDYDVFIAEMGARSVGDIAELCDIVKPDYAMITGVCPQHVQTFFSLENIISTKGEILSGTKQSGSAVIGLDENTQALFDECTLNKLGVGENTSPVGYANVTQNCDGTAFDLLIDGKTYPVKTKLLGGFCAKNIALAAAMARLLKVPAEDIAAAVATLSFTPHRLELTTSNAVNILDDSFNSNVLGAREAVKVLRMLSGKHVVVTPGIIELGIIADAENEKLGAELVGLDKVILVGETLLEPIKRGYLEAGGEQSKLVVTPTLNGAKAVLASTLEAGDSVLFLNDLPDVVVN